MARDQIDPVLQQIHRLVGEPDAGELTDRQLLERFAYARDEVAFAALVRRHGPLVLGVSGRLLQQAQDAEDVFQATFLVLARKAGSMGWRASVRNWLYQVAFRLAKKARAARARRLVQERRAAQMPKSEVCPESAWRELCSVLDEELQRLPSKYRQPLLLCYLEGLTTDQAAQELNWSLRTLKRRLEQGRELMRLRLTRRGLTLSAAILSAGLAQKAAAVPTVLTAGTVKAAVEFAAASGTASVSANVTTLTEGALRGLAAGRARIVVAILLLVGLGSAGTGAALYRAWSADLPDATHLELQAPDAGAQANQVILEEPGAPVQTKSVRNDLFGDPLPPGALARLGTVQWRHHHSSGMGVAFSPDGKAVASSGDLSLRLWNTATGKSLWRVQDDKGFGRVLFSPNGKWLAVRGGTLLDAATGRVLRQISPGGYLLAISPDSSLLATSKRDASVTVYDTATGQEVRHLPASEGEQLTSGIFTPDSHRLLTLSFSRSARNTPWRMQLLQWDMTTGAIQKTIDVKIPQWRTLRFSNDARSLAVVPYSLEAVSLWDVETGKERCKLQGKPACARYGLAFSPDGKTLATDWTEEGSRETLISLWDAGTGKFLRRFTIPIRCSESLHFSPDGRTLLTAGEPRVRLWDTVTGQSFAGLPGHDGQVCSLSFTPDGKFLLSSGGDSSIRVWEVATARHLHEHPGPFLGASAVAALPDSRTFLSTADDHLLHLRDLHTGKELRRFAADTPVEQLSPDGHMPTRFILAADGRTAASLSVAGKAGERLNVWDVGTGRAVVSRIEDPKPQWSLFSPSAKIMVGYIDTQQGNPAPVGKIVPKMAPLAKAGGSEQRFGNTHVVLQEVATGRQLLTLPQPDHYGHRAAFSPDERTLVTSTYRVLPGDNGSRWESHNLHLWELATGRERLNIKVGKNERKYWIEQIAFASDGRTFAIAREDRTIQLLDVATGKELLRHTGYDAPVRCLAFTPNARALASGHSDSTILLWDLSPALRPRAAKAPATAQELEQLWSDLASANAGTAHAAIWAMVDQPVLAPEIISRRIQPAREIPAALLHRYIADLDSNQFQAREEAARQLANLEEEALLALREALKANPSPEQRRRIEVLLAAPSIVRSPERLRQLRAVEVLEHIGSSEAQEILAKLATGAPNARLTQEASTSLERLKRPSTASLPKSTREREVTSRGSKFGPTGNHAENTKAASNSFLTLAEIFVFSRREEILPNGKSARFCQWLWSGAPDPCSAVSIDWADGLAQRLDPPTPQNVAIWHTHFFSGRKRTFRQWLRLQLSLPTVANSLASGKLICRGEAFTNVSGRCAQIGAW